MRFAIGARVPGWWHLAYVRLVSLGFLVYDEVALGDAAWRVFCHLLFEMIGILHSRELGRVSTQVEVLAWHCLPYANTIYPLMVLPVARFNGRLSFGG